MEYWFVVTDKPQSLVVEVKETIIKELSAMC